jgi:MtrB/PioB family decaheme-associated outer membrane protein
MKKIYIPLTAILTLMLPLSGHAEETSAGGEIELTPTLANVTGSKAKFNEYRDTKDGVYGAARLWRETDDFFFKFQADDILYDNQSFRVDGGNYGKYKFNLYYDEIPHNLSYDAKTFYSGAGTANLTYSGVPTVNVAPSTNTATWNTFDYEVHREKQGGGIRFDMAKPYYVDVSFNRENREGIKPAGVAPGTGGGSSALELPEPVDYVTDSLKAEIGYGLNPFFGSVSYFYSNFKNDNDNLFFRHPSAAVGIQDDVFTLAPDNDYYKVAFKGKSLLPFSSALSVNAARSVAESSVGLQNNYLSQANNGAVTVANLTNLSGDYLFDGKVVTTNYDAVLTSNPIPLLDGKIFYKYHEKENKSDEINLIQSGITFQNHLFGYEKKTYGAEVGFKLPAHVTLTPSYKHVKTERHRGDLPETKDKVYAVNGRWTGLDFMTVSAGYERLDRTAVWDQLEVTYNSGTTPDTNQEIADRIEQYVRRFDAAPLDRDTYKLSLDIYPAENLSLGLGYRHKKSNYTDTILGLRDEESDTYDLSADYVLGAVTLAGYFSYEKTEYYQFQRRLNSGGVTDTQADPATAPATNYYNWDLNEELKNFDYGVSAEVVLVPDKWRLRAQYDHVRSDGLADFTVFKTTGDDALDHQSWDDYKKKSFLVKAIYDVNKNISTTLGFAHERYRYNDAALDDYRYTFTGTTNASTLVNMNYLTGAYADQSYEANVVFANLKYSF